MLRYVTLFISGAARRSVLEVLEQVATRELRGCGELGELGRFCGGSLLEMPPLSVIVVLA